MRTRLTLIVFVSLILAVLLAGWTWDDGILVAASWVS